MPIFTNVGGVWKKNKFVGVNVAGAWKEVKHAFIKVDGIWKPCYNAEIVINITSNQMNFNLSDYVGNSLISRNRVVVNIAPGVILSSNLKGVEAAAFHSGQWSDQLELLTINVGAGAYIIGTGGLGEMPDIITYPILAGKEWVTPIIDPPIYQYQKSMHGAQSGEAAINTRCPTILNNLGTVGGGGGGSTSGGLMNLEGNAFEEIVCNSVFIENIVKPKYFGARLIDDYGVERQFIRGANSCQNTQINVYDNTGDIGNELVTRLYCGNSGANAPQYDPQNNNPTVLVNSGAISRIYTGVLFGGVNAKVSRIQYSFPTLTTGAAAATFITNPTRIFSSGDNTGIVSYYPTNLPSILFDGHVWGNGAYMNGSPVKAVQNNLDPSNWLYTPGLGSNFLERGGDIGEQGYCPVETYKVIDYLENKNLSDTVRAIKLNNLQFVSRTWIKASNGGSGVLTNGKSFSFTGNSPIGGVRDTRLMYISGNNGIQIPT